MKGRLERERQLGCRTAVLSYLNYATELRSQITADWMRGMARRRSPIRKIWIGAQSASEERLFSSPADSVRSQSDRLIKYRTPGRVASTPPSLTASESKCRSRVVSKALAPLRQRTERSDDYDYTRDRLEVRLCVHRQPGIQRRPTQVLEERWVASSRTGACDR